MVEVFIPLKYANVIHHDFYSLREPVNYCPQPNDVGAIEKSDSGLNCTVLSLSSEQRGSQKGFQDVSRRRNGEVVEEKKKMGQVPALRPQLCRLYPPLLLASSRRL